MLRKALPVTIVVLALLVPAAPAGSRAQSSIPLPPEFRPEGIASGKGDSFYVGSIPLGAVFKGSYRTGEGAELVPPHPGRAHTGLKVDTRFDRLFVAGGDTKAIYVYDARTGADVATFPLPDAGFVNDVVLTRDAAYFTDSLVPQLHRVGIGRNGELTPPQRITYSGDLQFAQDFNVNGIDTAPGGRSLIVVQSNLGKLFRVDAGTGQTREIELDQPVTNGDGILRRGHTLYVVQNRDNKVDAVADEAGYTKGAVYSNFASKEDLFFAVYERRVERYLEDAERTLARNGTPDQAVLTIISETARRRERDDGWLAVFLEFWTHVLRHPEHRARFAAIHARAIDPFAAILEEFAAERRGGVPRAAPHLGGGVFSAGNVRGGGGAP